MDYLKYVDFIVIHHTERNNDFPIFVKARHRYLRGWDDIGYHYLIGNRRPFTKDGKLYSGRPEEYQGAHAIGYNNCSLGVCLIGNLDKTKPSHKQLATLFSFLDEKIKEYDLDVNHIVGHNELPNAKKSCPGRKLDMDYVRAVVSGQEKLSALFDTYYLIGEENLTQIQR